TSPRGAKRTSMPSCRPASIMIRYVQDRRYPSKNASSRRLAEKRSHARNAADDCISNTWSCPKTMFNKKPTKHPIKPDSFVYECEKCGSTETIEAEVIAYFDEIDPGLPGQPATFAC